MTDVLLTNYLSAVWAPCYHLLSPAPTFILHLHKTDSASTSEYLKVPQGTSWYLEVLQSTSKYSLLFSGSARSAQERVQNAAQPSFPGQSLTKFETYKK